MAQAECDSLKKEHEGLDVIQCVLLDCTCLQLKQSSSEGKVTRHLLQYKNQYAKHVITANVAKEKRQLNKQLEWNNKVLKTKTKWMNTVKQKI